MYLNKNDKSNSINITKPVEIWMVRHGETIFNIKGLVQGWCDSPLTKKGVITTSYLGKGLKEKNIQFEALYSSDLTRCLDTSQILLDNMGISLEINLDKRLREINTGDGEGDPITEQLKKYPHSFNFKKHPGTPNGENWDDVFNRVIPALKDIGEAHKLSGGKILVVSHTMTIAAVMGYLNPEQEIASSVPNSSVTIFEYEDGNLFLKKEPDTSYSEIGINISESKLA
ncbi:histidine phosphatase family protein [Tepidibacter mesophilus]|uniref:histidine phosphatase family protein n=1 Tax=Tepidibacter mesophilus TaxID=655607 RepID=UPI000C0823D0|nr:histidine phosphatase family protein [Tepidibacter mesophilus]